MDFEISKEKLKITLQRVLNSELDDVRELSKEWGLGEMGDLEVLDSVEKIEVVNVVTYTKIKVYINIYSNSNKFDKNDYQDLRAELQYRIDEWIPNIHLYINNVEYL